MIVRFSPFADNIIANYFNNYEGTQNHNDMVQRAYHLSRIRVAMSHITALDSYQIDDKTFVDIDDICTVEYEFSENGTAVVILNIYFHKKTEEDKNWRIKLIIH
jgi:hypothetical protein